MNRIQLVVFDIAGTTVRDKGDVAGAFIGAFHKAGIEIPGAAVNKVMGFRKIDAIRTLLDTFDPGAGGDGRELVVGGRAELAGGREELADGREELAVRIHTAFENAMVSFYEHDTTLIPLPHAEAVFARLGQMGIRVALDTGFTRAITDAILHRLDWANGNKGIDKVICSDEVAEGRPHPDMIRALMKAFGIGDAAHVLKVGDTEVDVEEGRNAGCGIVVSVTTGAYTREQLKAYHPDHIIDDLLDLITIIETV